jgi:ATP synthase protein I
VGRATQTSDGGRRIGYRLRRPCGRLEKRDFVRSDLKGLSDYGTVGLDLVLSIVFGFFAGRWLDGKFSTHPWLTLIGFMFGVIAGFRGLYRAALKMRKETEAQDERERRARRQEADPPS